MFQLCQLQVIPQNAVKKLIVPTYGICNVCIHIIQVKVITRVEKCTCSSSSSMPDGISGGGRGTLID